MSDSTPQTYSLEILAETTGVSTQMIVQYQEHGIIDQDFDDETDEEQNDDGKEARRRAEEAPVPPFRVVKLGN